MEEITPSAQDGAGPLFSSRSILPQCWPGGEEAFFLAISDLAKDVEGMLKNMPHGDDIQDCGSAALHIVEERPDDVMALAHQKLNSWPFKDVPKCWRRLYEEASLWKIVQNLRHKAKSIDCSDHRVLKRKRSISSSASKPDEVSSSLERDQSSPDWVTNAVHVLDMALILTGGPGRRQIYDHILASLSQFLTPVQKDLSVTFPAQAMSTAQPGTIERKARLDFVEFQHHLDNASSPLILTGVLDDWPAIADPKHNWANPQYLMQCTLGGRRLVPVEMGRSYTDEDWGQRIMTFAEYMHDYLLEPNPARTGYLAQHDLFEQIPALEADTIVPDYSYTSPPPPVAGSGIVAQPTLDEPLKNAWLGPRSTISPLHTDPYHNILCQVVGYKYVRLYAPGETPKLYPRGVDEAGVSMENTSRVDIALARKLYDGLEDVNDDGGKGAGDGEDVDVRCNEFEERFPLFKTAQYIEGILGPGECLYLAPGWWHYISSLSTSFSMSFWWN